MMNMVFLNECFWRPKFNTMVKDFIPRLSYSCYGILLHPIKPGLTPLLYRFEKQIGPIKTKTEIKTKKTDKEDIIKSTLQSFSTTISDHIKFKNNKTLSFLEMIM